MSGVLKIGVITSQNIWYDIATAYLTYNVLDMTKRPEVFYVIQV
jgi:hypothetical protein